VSALAAAGRASVVKLKNAKAPPHSVDASGREQKDVDDAGEDDGGSGA